VDGFDDCEAGAVCLREQCGGVNRCYRLCSDMGQCDGLRCSVTVNTANPMVTFTACDVPRQDCDPIAKTGCPNGLNCLLLNTGQTLCDCYTSGGMGVGEGAPCGQYSDCKVGLTCVNAACRPICTPSKPTCAAGMMCTPIGPKYGFCSP
jgi:hypothetical protein